MTTGMPRRQQAQDNLAGRDQIEPVRLQGPGIKSPTPMQTASRNVNTAQRLAQELSQWGQGKLAAAVEKQQQRDILDGQMAHMQGQSMDQVKMGGRPWALEGYRLIDAQSMASSMLAAQRAEIANGGYQMTPDQFREHMGNRVEGMLDGVDDRTAELVRAQVSQQLPVLIGDHTTQHLTHQEQQAFNSLERSIDVVSRDPSSVDALLDFAAGGDDSPSAGLTDERRQAAVVSGIVRAFSNDNPMAYSAIMGSGLLGESLTTQQQSAIRSAKSQYEQRRRQEYDASFLNAEKDLLSRMEAGDLSPSQAAEEYVDLYAQQGIEVTRAEVGAIYDQADNVQETENRTASVLIEDALLREDYDTVARVSARALHGSVGVRVQPGQSSIPQEGNLTSGDTIRGTVNAAVETVLGNGARVVHTSGYRNNDTNGDGVPDRRSQHGTHGASDFKVIRPDGTEVRWDDPEAKEIAEVAASMGVRGFGAGPTYMGGSHFHMDLGHGGNGAPVRGRITVWSDDDGGASDRGPGAVSWMSDLTAAAAGASGLSDEQAEGWNQIVTAYKGDVVAASVAYNHGSEQADAYLAGNPSAEAQATAEQTQQRLNDWRAPTAADRLNVATQQLAHTRERLALDTYEQVAPQLARTDQQFQNGRIDEATWRQRRADLYSDYDMARTEADVNHEIRVAQARSSAVQQAVEEAQGQDYAIALENAQMEIMPHRQVFEEVVNDPTVTTAQRQAAVADFQQAQRDIYDGYGIEVLDRGRVAATESILENWQRGEKAYRARSEDDAIIGNAVNANTAGTLPAGLQQRAVDEFDAQLATRMTNLRNENPDLPESTIGALERSFRIDFLSQNGIVDEDLQQTVNLAASGTAWINKQGEPNPSTVAGLQAFMGIMSQNRSLAYQYVPDREARGRMLAATHMVQTQHPNRDVFTDVDLTNRDDPVANSFHTAVEQVGLAMAQPISDEETADRVNRALSLAERGNVTNSTFGGVGAADAASALVPLSLLRAGMSSRFDAADVRAAVRLDRDALNADFQASVNEVLEETVPYMPATDQQGAVTMALDYVRERGAVIGSTYVMPGPAAPSIRAQMFPGQQVENTAAVNTAVAQWMQDPEVQAANPVLENFDASFFGNTPEYTVVNVNGQYRAFIPGHGSLVLPLREIGDRYIANR